MADNPQTRAHALAARLPPLLAAAERVAACVHQGGHGRRRVGPGEIFWQFRRFQAGDAAADIDWRRSARSLNLHVRETEWAAANSVWLWRDGSASMDFRSEASLPTKGERATLILLALAVLLLRGGERVAALSSRQSAPPSSGGSVLERLADILDQGGGDSLAAGIPRHARIVMAGDFLDPPESLAATLAGFAAIEVRGVLLQIFDPAEESLPYRGRVRFEDPEGGPPIILGSVEKERAKYLAALKAHNQALAAIAAAHGWTILRHGTDCAPAAGLLALYNAMAN